MAIIAPAVLAEEPHAFREQMERIQPFAERIQIDLTDGDFVQSRTIELEQVWWPYSVLADLHLMYRRPMEYLHQVIKLRPHMVIVHAEAEVHHMYLAAELHKADIKAGLCILQDTPVDNVKQIMHSFDHLLIFSGSLGQFGGEASLGLLDKVSEVRNYYPDIEIGWDGGINDQNAKPLATGGVDVLDVGGFIQHSENPSAAYQALVSLI